MVKKQPIALKNVKNLWSKGKEEVGSWKTWATFVGKEQRKVG